MVDGWLALSGRMAGELDRAGHLLENLAVQLCLDSVVFDRHAVALQRFDEVTQMIGEVASLLRNRGTLDDATAAVRLDAMRDRLEGATGTDAPHAGGGR